MPLMMAEKLWSSSDGEILFATVNIFITVWCNMVAVHDTPVSFVLLVIHLGAALPLQLLFLKAIVAFTSSTDRVS